MSLRSRYWRARFARWSGAAPALETPGYTVLVPVPGDLPVFLELALGTIRAQTARHRVATYVVADQPSPAVTALVEQYARDWPGELRELRIGQPEATLLPKLGDPGRNHGVQIITGLTRTRSTYTVLHDADLFLLHPDIHDRQYETAVARDLDVIGVSPSWDAWYADHGLHLAATWEMCARTAWFRAFPPWRVISHEDEILGETHMFDTTFFAQTRTDQARIAVQPVPEIVHFNYVISTYRKFVWHGQDQGAGFPDDSFRLLLIRLISALFAEHHAPDQLPTFAVLAQGLTDPGAQVVYAMERRSTYLDFRRQTEQILRGPWPEDKIAEARAGLAPFDAAYGWEDDLDADAPTASGSAALTADRPRCDVTVVVPVRDRAGMLDAALASVDAQTVLPAEVIVVDDGSVDESGAVAAKHGATVIRHDVSLGVGAARNRAMAAATTTWVAFLDSDDLWAPEHLAALLRSATDDALLVSAPALTSHGRWSGNARGHDVPLTVESLLVPGDGLTVSGTMVRRADALAVGGFPEDGRLVEDVALWIRLLRRGRGVETSYPSVAYLVHDGQMSHHRGTVRDAYEDVVRRELGGDLSPGLDVRHRSRQVWDTMRDAQGARDLRGVGDGVAFYLRHPASVPALGKLLAHRRRTRLAHAAVPGSYLAPGSPERTQAPVAERHPIG